MWTIDDVKVANCKNCGHTAELKGSTGGFNYYYWVECSNCKATTRGRGIMTGLVPMGGNYAFGNDTPQDSRELALKRWDKVNDLASNNPEASAELSNPPKEGTPMNTSKTITIEISGKEGKFDVTQIFRDMLKKICTGNLSYDELEALGIEDILVDRDDPAGIVYKIVVASWEGEGGL